MNDIGFCCLKLSSTAATAPNATVKTISEIYKKNVCFSDFFPYKFSSRITANRKQKS